MTTAAQFAANRRNAKKSTGPRTREGKTASSRNALKHGLTAETYILPGEDPHKYEMLRQQVFDEINPNSLIAQILTERLTGLLWRLRRASAFEASLFAWIAHQQSERHDIPLESHDRMDDKIGGLDDACAGITTRNEANSGGLTIGRCLEKLLERELVCKLTRYEAHLANQVRCTLSQLQSIARPAEVWEDLKR